MSTINFFAIHEADPNYDDVASIYRELKYKLADASSVKTQLDVIRTWDQLRRQLYTWWTLTHLRFNQDTRNEEYKKARDHCDEVQPKLTELENNFKRQLLNSLVKPELESHLGRTAFLRWEADIKSYDPVIEKDTVAESKLKADYIELVARKEVEFRGEKYTLSAIQKFSQEPDRELRYEARKATWNWAAENGEALDGIYDEQVKLRAAMARKLGFDNFIGLGYQRMCRLDYGRQDVARFREQVRDYVVPFAAELRGKQAARLGVEKLYDWDEALNDPRGNPKPRGDHDWLLDRAQEMFDGMGGGLGSFFRMMRTSNLMDLKIREGKSGGGFCTDFPKHGLPFIFANFNGTKGDVEVFTHEMGHAFQSYLSRDKPLIDYLWPTTDACEIHSMSLEFLTWGYMEKFFSDDAERFRRSHLETAILFLPYGVAVDHFQHLVYEKPEASAADRKVMWQEMERVYLPWRDYGDMIYPAEGGRWQLQRHIYLHPFYYIDYTLAQTCAIQFWVRARRDDAEAMEAYVALCRRGGEALFQELVASADLVSPFHDDCLREVVDTVRRELEL